MANVNIKFNGKEFLLSCDDGQEEHLEELALYLSEKFCDYVVMLRLNCEGVEDNVIYSAHTSFGNKLELICGSLKDVAEVKGFDAYQELDRFIADQGIAFAQFNSPIYTWLEGQKSIQKLLRKIN